MNDFLMTDDFIVSQLKEKEMRLVAELNKVRLALDAFLNQNKVEITGMPVEVPKEYLTELTYGNKILFILKERNEPMLVSDIVEAVYTREPLLDKEKLQKNISYNLSMLAKYSKVKKHPFNRKIKYSL